MSDFTAPAEPSTSGAGLSEVAAQDAAGVKCEMPGSCLQALPADLPSPWMKVVWGITGTSLAQD